MIKDHVVYFTEFLKEFQNTGTCFPSSKWAARALTNPMRATRTPQRILELGPGTGVVTVRILKDMIPGDRLTICEINPRFMAALKENLKSNPDYQLHKANISFFEGPAQEIPEDGPYDLIVCALPFLNFDLTTVEEIFSKLQRVSTAHTKMTYYEYIGLRSIGKMVAPAERKQNLKKLDVFFSGMYKRHNMQRERVWLNFLPINIYTLHMAPA
ncbi:MAG: methyltransferase domain-containing protein [Deltaproteobacteria bacterium]|nr:methyltransferase domain-containing protein [Deltaproteobacteria bacterium]